MSDARFASITSALLVRKGQAATSPFGPVGRSLPSYESRSPSPAPRPVERRADMPAPVPAERKMPQPPAPERGVPVPTERTARATDKKEPPSADRKRRVVVTLSSEEYLRLGIVAAKKNASRQDLVRGALFQQLDAFARTEAADCHCVGTDEPCDCEASFDGDVDGSP